MFTTKYKIKKELKEIMELDTKPFVRAGIDGEGRRKREIIRPCANNLEIAFKVKVRSPCKIFTRTLPLPHRKRYQMFVLSHKTIRPYETGWPKGGAILPMISP